VLVQAVESAHETPHLLAALAFSHDTVDRHAPEAQVTVELRA
jgi:hypothetical protein